MADQGPASSDLKQWLNSQAEAMGEPETALSPYHDTEDDFSVKTPSAASQRPSVLSPKYKEEKYLWHEDGKDEYPQMDLAKQAYRSGLPAGPTRQEQVVQSLQQDGPATREELAARIGIDDPTWKMLSYAIGAGKRSGEVYEENGMLYPGVKRMWEGNMDPNQMPKVTKEFAKDLSLKLLAFALDEEDKEEQKQSAWSMDDRPIFDRRQPFLMNQEGQMVVGPMGTHHEDLEEEEVEDVFNLSEEDVQLRYWDIIGPLEGHIIWENGEPIIQWPAATDEGARVFEENLLSRAKYIQEEFDWIANGGKEAAVFEPTEVQEQEEDTKDEESAYAKSKRLWYEGIWREVTPASAEGLEHEE
jgi:hypothetical protein